MRTFPHRTIGVAYRPAALAIAMLLVGAACGQSDDDPFGNVATDQDSQALTEASVDEAGGDRSAPRALDGAAAGHEQPPRKGRSPLAESIIELPPAPTGLPVLEPAARRPVGLTIDAIGVDFATVIDVGIEANGDMEIPPADQVGWYRYGPTPGAGGASVLAAHIAYDGRNGVFVDLDQLPIGSIITVNYDDGSTADFEAVSKEQYDKSELPREQVWGRDGDPRLVLITCGGAFNRRVSSYEDNVVIYADPVAPAAS